MTLEDKEKYMRRAIELAANGRAYASPNSMVGAVIVASDGRVIGEGWHRRCGEGHAEVNAVASVKEADVPLLDHATMFVTLEPCSHFGKTPPCAAMIVEKRIPHVVVAMGDPNPKVSGRGIAMLREAGVEVEVGVLEERAKELNRKFLTSVCRDYPFITLKWARSEDGFMDWKRTTEHPSACRFSSALSSITTMKLRAEHDALLTTSATLVADNPRLNLHDYSGRLPQRFVVVRNTPLPVLAADGMPFNIFADGENSATIYDSKDFVCLHEIFADMKRTNGISSVLIESGPTFLNALLAEGLWDDVREEISPVILGSEGVKAAPRLPANRIVDEKTFPDGNLLRFYRNNDPCKA